MDMDHVFKKPNKRFFRDNNRKPEVPKGLLCKCSKCGGSVFVEDIRKNENVCPKCNGYLRVKAYERIRRVVDKKSFRELNAELTGGNPMNYEGYEEKIAAARLKTRLKEAVVTGKCKIDGNPAVLCVMDGRFLMASMGSAVGEKITLAVEFATRERLPIIIFACSGGARMQEGITSLMQMAKTSAALKKHSDTGLLYISVLTDPTTGGVTASFAMEGDIILAEPGALIGFAGPRVIEQTIKQKLPKGFQRSEFLLEHGFIDRIVERSELKKTLGDLLRFHSEKAREISFEVEPKDTVDGKHSMRFLEKSAWERVQRARDKKRPTGS
ncbi:MAG: acetyl-CoA carboxylase carboxyltransferase subunit beta, partial [Lachnospiraceae bacterium]|nr:acetyl-CoA carboxylase carboxyltransferase subunit beta [Lachnospiraceae bacterium]